MGGATHRQTVIISAVIVTLLAVLAFIAAIGNVFDWSGWWVVTVAVALAAFTLGWKLWTDVIQPSRQRTEANRAEQSHSQAVHLRFADRDDGAVGVSITNHGTHEVRHIEIVGIPEGGDMDAMLAGPPFSGIDGGPSAVSVSPMPAGDLYAIIERLTPNRGYCIGTYDCSSSRVRRIKFDVSWIDHDGLRRASGGIGDLAEMSTDVALEPRRTSRPM